MLIDIKLLKTRNKLIDFLYQLGIIITTPLVVLSMFRALKTEFRAANISHIITLILFFIIYYNRKKINYNIKAIIILITLYLVSTIGLFSNATLSTDMMTFLLLIFTSSMLFGKKIGGLVTLLVTITITIFGVLYVNEFIKLKILLTDFVTDETLWIDKILSFSLYSTVILLLINKFYDDFKQNIDELEEKSNKLSIEKDFLATTFESMYESVITTDKDGNITFVNKQAENLTAYLSKELIGQNINLFEIVNEETRVKINDIFGVISKKESNKIKFVIFTSKNNEKLIVEFRTSYINGVNNEIIGIIITFRDVTEKRKQEKEILKLKKLESIGYLAGGIAHSFNNLLFSIVGNLDLAQIELKENKIENANENINVSLKACMQATYLTHKLLTFSKGGKPVKEKMSIKPIIEDSLNFLLYQKNIISKIDIPNDLWLINADSSQMSQVIQVFISNSIDSIVNNGKIFISCRNKKILKDDDIIKTGEYIEITIIDNGYGIIEKNIAKIFDPYFTTKEEGRGLGLSIAYSIIKNHHGYVIIDSKFKGGANFKIYLPRVSGLSNKNIVKAVKSSDIISEESRKKKILIMDDEEMIRDILSRTLHKLNYEVTATTNGCDAIKEYKEGSFDLSIFDITIPSGMNGDKAAAKILEFDKNAKIIASSGYSTEASIQGYKEIGFLDFIAKPYRIKELEEKINSFI